MSRPSKLNVFIILTSFILVPEIFGVYETPEFVYLPRYFGCFHSTLYFQVPDQFQGTHFYFNSFGVLPAECITFCLRNSSLAFEIAAIKGQLCICAHVSDNEHLAYDLQKVPAARCDIECRKKRTSIDTGNVIVPNEHCGGNIPYSIYCAVPPNNKTSGPVNNNNFCKNLWIGSVAESNLYLGDFTTYFNFRTECGACLNDSVICPQWIFADGQGEGQQNRSDVIGFEYSPKNSPLSCINHCRRLLGIRIDFVAILGSSTKNMGGASVDTCFCIRSTGINLYGFEKVDSQNCNEICPGDGSLNCAESRVGDGPEYFVLYGIFSNEYPILPTPPCVNENAVTDAAGMWEDCNDDETKTTEANSTDETTTPTTTTVETTTPTTTTVKTTTPTTTTVKTTTPTTTTVKTTTPTTTTFETSPTYENTTVKTSIPSISTVAATKELTTTTVRMSGPETTSTWATTIATTPKPDCTVECSFTDYGHHWHACAGQNATRKCLGNTNGTMFWKCGSGGEFIGKQDYSNCSAPWIDDLKDQLCKESDLDFDRADEFLKFIEKKCTEASNWDEDSIYFGHEIAVLMNLGVTVMYKLNTSQASIQMFEELASVMTSIVGIVLTYPQVWEQLSAKERCATGTELLSVIEQSFFTLSTKVVEDENLSDRSDLSYHYEPNTSDFPFNVETGVVLKSENRGQVLRFPNTRRSDKESFIELPEDWHSATFGLLDNDEVEFVGIQMGVTTATNLFYPEKESCGSDESSCASVPVTRIVNSNMMSFSFGDKYNSTRTTFTGRGVRISFEHDVMAWGTSERPIRRKLHSGERQKAIQESAACMFWDTDDQLWSSRGCKIVESHRTKTVCECNHLTAFALLMDVHNYEGKKYWLELLTLILSPISILCLVASIIIFFRIKEIQGPRTTITRNLCICLLIGMLLVITVMDRNYIWLSDNLCMVTAMLIHYIFLCVFAWMALEGLLLYKMVILVFDTQGHHMNFQRGGAYGIPLLIVGMTYVIGFINEDRVYGGDEYCWLEDNYKWGFMGPVAVITVVNLVILVATLRKAYNLQRSPKAKTGQKRKKSIISWIRGTFGVTVLLGGTWVFGFLMGIPNPTVSWIAACIFTILNASQGIFLFIFHCVLNKKVREHLSGRFPAWSSIATLMTRSDSSSSRLRVNKKSDSLSISDDSNYSRRNNTKNAETVEQIGRCELVPDF